MMFEDYNENNWMTNNPKAAKTGGIVNNKMKAIPDEL